MGIKVKDIAYARFQAPDLDKMEEFLVDFGLVRSERTADTLYMRGLNDAGFVHVTHLADEAKPLGWGLLANSVEDLEALSGTAGFGPVEDLDGPGGGKVVRAYDPDGFLVEVVAGRGSVGTLPAPEWPERNELDDYVRKGSPVRLTPGPAHVKRLGHALYMCKDYQVSKAWYSENLGFVVSDEIHLEDGTVLGAFMRCDQGKDYVDHHTIGLIGTGQTGFNHIAFEVLNLDDLMMGNAALFAKGYEHSHGIGRHILGSQIFDYWKDPFGHTVEHWTDGDLFNDETPPNIASREELAGDQWGPTNTFKRVPAGR